jgi:hypothetical protein
VGEMPDSVKYKLLESNSQEVKLILTNSLSTITAILAQFANFNQETLNICINEDDFTNRTKNSIKNFFRNKAVMYISLEHINTLILEIIKIIVTIHTSII